MDERAGAVDVERVAARVGRRAQVHCAAGDGDGRVAEARRFLDDVVAEGEAAAGDQNGRGVGGRGEGRVGDDDVAARDREGGRVAYEGGRAAGPVDDQGDVWRRVDRRVAHGPGVKVQGDLDRHG